jgi:hypothetical protein
MNKSQDDVSLSLEEPVTPMGRLRADYFSIGDLAVRWRCSRGTVYNMIRGERVLDFAAPGRRGKKLVPAAVVSRIEERRMKVFR